MFPFDKAESGTKVYRNRFFLNPRKIFDARFGELIPAFMQFCLPGDVWKIIVNCFIRLQPMRSPTLTRMWARFRFFFVPLRQIEKDAELIITGSKEGKLYTATLPTFDNIFANLGSGVAADVQKYSFMDYAFGAPIMDYSAFKTDECLPAAYWLKGYWKCWFDWYRDENLDSDNDFDTMMATKLADNSAGLADKLAYVRLHKDYFMSALPWQLKGVAPTFSINPVADFTSAVQTFDSSNNAGISLDYANKKLQSAVSGVSHDAELIEAMNKVSISGGTFTMADLRAMGAQTRVFERLARTGSRYTEYLRANFGTAPADETLQRSKYLGGFTQPIVCTEVVQTAQDSTNPVGTLRGHGISNDAGKIKPFVCKEFGMLIGLFDVMPEVSYTNGIDRQYTYKRRFDFMNPSFQHLSEQEVRNGEIFIGSDGKNDETFGFQSMYNELRSSRQIVCGDMRDSLRYWNQAVSYSTRPNLNAQFIDSKEYLSNFNQPFAVYSPGARPVIVDTGFSCDVARTLVRYGTPGLIDHL